MCARQAVGEVEVHGAWSKLSPSSDGTSRPHLTRRLSKSNGIFASERNRPAALMAEL